LKVPCSYLLTVMGTFALLRYLSEFRLRVFVVLIIGNSRTNHVGAQGTFQTNRTRICMGFTGIQISVCRIKLSLRLSPLKYEDWEDSIRGVR